ncbi:mRNA surveillance protein pelota [Candidatus Woesearchaeota archaeon]|nr:mRNA surveillance protein pelota [Candidatus Woesearchaeota archaeon]
MKILKKELKHGKVVVQAQSLDDLWCLSQTVSKGDTVAGKTTRKVKLGSAEEAVKKTYFLTIATEDVKFEEQALRISGKTTEPNEDIPKGAHHTITIEPGDALTVIKERWQKYQLDRLDQATQEQLKALIVVFDRETALIARLKTRGYEVITELKGKVRRKDYDTSTATNFYKEIIAYAKDYDERNKPDKIILASPAFWKEELLNELKSDPKAGTLKNKIVLATCSSVSENAIDEVLKRPEMDTVLATAMAAKEMKLVDEMMTEIARDGKVAYGLKEVEGAIEAAAVEKLLISDVTVYKNQSSEQLMKKVEDTGGKVFIINSENAAGQKLDALGGMAALLRYRTS